jgi:hypothetical protein
MAFKGTESIGTLSWPAEKKALDAVEKAYDRVEAEVNKGIKADSPRIDMLRNQAHLSCRQRPSGRNSPTSTCAFSKRMGPPTASRPLLTIRHGLPTRYPPTASNCGS